MSSSSPANPGTTGLRLPLGDQWVFLPTMADSTRRPTPDAQADQRIQEILRAADSWSREAPRALMPAIRAVCIRLAEMVADQRQLPGTAARAPGNRAPARCCRWWPIGSAPSR